MLYEPAIRQIIEAGLLKHVPELTGVYDEDLLLQEHKERYSGELTGREVLQYPFVSLRVEGEEQIGGYNPPLVARWVRHSSLNPSFEYDLVEESPFVGELTFRVSLYDRPAQWERLWRVRRQALNYFAAIADEELSPTDGTYVGLGVSWVSPATGRLIEDQDDPPDDAVLLKCLVSGVGRGRNETTLLNVAMNEARWSFPVRIRAMEQYELRWPTIEKATIKLRMTEPAEPEPPQPAPGLELVILTEDI